MRPALHASIATSELCHNSSNSVSPTPGGRRMNGFIQDPVLCEIWRQLIPNKQVLLHPKVQTDHDTNLRGLKTHTRLVPASLPPLDRMQPISTMSAPPQAKSQTSSVSLSPPPFPSLASCQQVLSRSLSLSLSALIGFLRPTDHVLFQFCWICDSLTQRKAHFRPGCLTPTYRNCSRRLSSPLPQACSPSSRRSDPSGRMWS